MFVCAQRVYERFQFNQLWTKLQEEEVKLRQDILPVRNEERKTKENEKKENPKIYVLCVI